MENHPRYLEVALGVPLRRVIYTACSSRLTSSELSYILNDCTARVFITSKYKADQAVEIVDDTPGVELRLMLDGVDRRSMSRYEDAVARSSDDPLPDPIAGTDMLYSSGTTGRPKGVMPPFAHEPLATATNPVARADGSCCSASRPSPCTCRRRRCTTPLRCGSPCPPTPSARRSS